MNQKMRRIIGLTLALVFAAAAFAGAAPRTMALSDRDIDASVAGFNEKHPVRELAAEAEASRITLREDYAEGAGESSWSVAPAAAQGHITLTLPAGGTAVHLAPQLAGLEYGAYTWVMEAGPGGAFGLVTNYAGPEDCNLFFAREGSLVGLNRATGEETSLGELPYELPQGRDFILQLVYTPGSTEFYIDGILAASGDAAGLSTGKGTFGLYNPTQAEVTYTLASVEATELFTYYNDFSGAHAPEAWDGAGVTAAQNTQGAIDGSQELVLTAEAEGVAFATDTPLIANGTYEFDLMTRNCAGNFAFLFRGINPRNYEGLAFEMGETWYAYNIVNGRQKLIAYFPGDFAMADETVYHVRIELKEHTVSLWMDDVLVGTRAYSWPVREGFFGIRKLATGGQIHLDNLKITESYYVSPREKEVEPITISGQEMTVTMDQGFPRVMDYTLGQLHMTGNPRPGYELLVNGKACTPVVICEKPQEDTLLYTLISREAGVTAKLQYVVEGRALRMNFLDIQEKGEKVRTIGLENDVLFTVDSTMENVSVATVSDQEGWTSISEEIVTDLADLPDGTSNQTYAMAAANGLAATVNNSVIENRARMTRRVTADGDKITVSIANGVYDYRTPNDKKQPLPSAVVLLCEDYNGDGEVSWQDAAANYRNIRSHVKGEDEIKNSVMWISYNAGSQVEEPFLKSLDMAKTVYNYTDGFGQFVMQKGYQDEGHDASHGDYGGTVGIRQGGREDFNAVIEAGKEYNVTYGVHINVNEHMLDSRYFDENVMLRPFAGNWGYYDQAYLVDQAKDIISGHREENLRRMKEDLPELGFIYVDIYGIDAPAGWMSNDLLTTANDLGWMVGTEFAGPMEQGVAFTHWGNDILYPNTGNDSVVMKYFKHDLDISVSTALTLGNKMLNIATWQNVSDMKSGVETFYNHTLLTKYLQHHALLDYEEDYAVFSDGVRTERQGDQVILTKDGRKMAQWSWTVNGQGQEETGEATLLLPWFSEDSQTKNPDDADKLYYWNPQGGVTTWEVPQSWADGTEFDVYRLIHDDKVIIGSGTVEKGQISLDVAEGIPCVLYKKGTQPRVAGDFGQCGHLKNPGFDDRDLTMWNPQLENTELLTQYHGSYDPHITLRPLEGEKAGTAQISQTMTGLEGGRTYTAYLFAFVSPDAELLMEVQAGDETAYVRAEPTRIPFYNFTKYNKTNYQKVKVVFDVPENESEATLTLKGTFRNTAPDCRIYLDDVRVWKNISRTPQRGEPGYEDHVIYEDFENVEQGFGPFCVENVLWGHPAHLSEYAPDYNQYLDYVVSGTYSLKLNPTGDQPYTILRSNPNNVRLLPDTAYDLSLNYITGTAGRYELRVRNTAGDVVASAPFEACPLAEGTHSLDHKNLSLSFTTGSSEDYYLSFDLVNPQARENPQAPEMGSWLERGFLSIDDVELTYHNERADRTLTFRPMNGEEDFTQLVRDGDPARIPTAPLKTNCRFLGWFLDEACTRAYAFGDAVTEDLTLYAAYEELMTEAAQKAAELIDAIGTVTADSEAAVQAARGAYDALTEAEKAMVTNVQTLEEAEKELDYILYAARLFKDVKTGTWYYEGINAMVHTGLMKGVSADTFAPNGRVTRAQVVTILYRMVGEPDAQGLNNPFTDVAQNQWFTDAILWANEAGVVKGLTADTFGPQKSVTREQLAAMLYRYARGRAGDISVLDPFADSETVSSYAREAMAWAVEEGLVSGVEGNRLNPQGTATRAQLATILNRFLGE